MTDTTENLVLEQIRLIRADQAAIKVDIRDVKNRLATVEGSLGTLKQHMGHLASAFAQQQISFDRLGDRVERIEKRLDLVS